MKKIYKVKVKSWNEIKKTNLKLGFPPEMHFFCEKEIFLYDEYNDILEREVGFFDSSNIKNDRIAVTINWFFDKEWFDIIPEQLELDFS